MRSFDQWRTETASEELFKMGYLDQWAGASLAVLLGISLGAWIPVTSDFVHLQPFVPLLLFVVSMSTAFVIERLHKRDGPSRRAWVVLCLGDLSLELFVASLVSCSQGVGKYAYGSILLVFAFAHGWYLQVRKEAPYLLAGLATALGLAFLLDVSPANATAFALLGPVCLIVMFIAGTASHRQHLANETAARQRDALSAQLLAQSHSAASGWERRFTDLLGVHHDIRNLLTSATIRTEVLSRNLSPSASEDVSAALDTVRRALREVRGVLTEAQRASNDAGEGEPVELLPALNAAVASLKPRLGTTAVSVDAPASVSVRMPGGEATLHRILHNLLLNSLEGDGSRHASRISVSATVQDHVVSLSVSDDGPGFPPALLAGPSPGFFTTKQHGTGLGLVTVESLVRASRGQLSRDNPPSGGALTTLRFRLANSSNSQVAA